MNSEMVLECFIAMAMLREVFSKIDIFTQQNGDLSNNNGDLDKQ